MSIYSCHKTDENEIFKSLFSFGGRCLNIGFETMF